MKTVRSLCVWYVVVVAVYGSLSFTASTYGDIKDPLDPFEVDDGKDSPAGSIEADEKKTPEQLISEAYELLYAERHPLDARTKLLIALKKDPEAYQADQLLAGYYLSEVGHFRLALNYVKQAQAIFEKRYGQPPYIDPRLKLEHSLMLRLLSQTRLNLDDYAGALTALDTINDLGYNDESYAGSRAWVLMKLGRVDEAIKVAQQGYAALKSEAERGQILNMLGILLSMTKQRQLSLDVFKKAVANEMAQGDQGRPATPLNNAGEVYKEIFDDVKAEEMWSKAISLPDGCEHVLPSLNLTLYYLDRIKLKEARETLDKFEGCVAQYSLRNGEEHRALVHLARGRVDLHAGRVDSAINHFNLALDRTQWFGKIGTSSGDMRAAAELSLAQAHRAKKNQLALAVQSSFTDAVALAAERAQHAFLAWWHMRRARQILTEDLDNFEDLYVRNTDSLLEYPTLGEVLATMPTKILEQRIAQFKNGEDGRIGATPYYKLYLAENYLAHGKVREARSLMVEVEKTLRPELDLLLKQQLLLLELGLTTPGTDRYASLASAIFTTNHAVLRNYGFRLPVNVRTVDESLLKSFDHSPLLLDNRKELQYEIEITKAAGEYAITFGSRYGLIGTIRVKGVDFDEAVRKLIEEIFTDET